jgi:glycosyltransferase involved in cell wall biosynthesis
VVQVLDAASVYALPARYEPFGLTILEAALSGCALVLGDIPSLRELWDGAAVFVDPDRSEALQNELRALCADRERLRNLAEKALARSRSFSAAKMTAGYLAAYRQLNPLFGEP